MPKTKVEVYNKDELIYPFIESDHVTFSNGMKVSEMLNQSISMPTVVHEDLSFKVGVGDQDVSSAIVDSSVAEMTIKGKTYQNILPEPSTLVLTNNKEMFKVNEGLDPNIEIVDGVSKSAILKGNTLVNLSLFKDTALNIGGVREKKCYNKDIIKPNTNYLISYNVVAVSGETVMKIDGMNVDSFPTELGKHKMIVRTISNLTTSFPNNLWITGNSNSIEIDDFLIIEYQDGMENLDIPYFEGMQSVKLPVLKTMGVNIFEGETERGYIDPSTGQNSNAWNDLRSVGYTEVIGGNTLRILVTHKNFPSPSMYEYDKDKNFIGRVNNNILSPHAKFVRFSIGGNTDVGGTSQVMLYYGDDIKREYEPHRTNILTVNEDVTLRSNGDICDELKVLTGQLTQRIGEDGVALSQEVIKTADLIPSGTHPSTTPYCWKDGHIQLSSSGLLPSLEYSVVTSRAGQISQNAAMIVKNDKRIFDLEILLAGGLVNTTYQALTLQNQVETGLSKVSLSSEKEPDYLLYHMIMKLIEEKAYKLDDLAEKVSVFYLYEKLSDEQFETIYAALYPFAEDEYFESDIPGDDEVIEEPIVDESLEEVEDEVVM